MNGFKYFQAAYSKKRQRNKPFRQPETFAKPIYLYNKRNRYRVGFPAHQPPDRAEFS
ncbi:MAG: hypothetical protein IJM09_03030 [Neisseriaceae bacterium]|nr:hypothetical protein [Neisseriaceae bacterium]